MAKDAYHLGQNDYSYKYEIKSKNNRSASNYRHYGFILIRKQYVRMKITDVTDIAVVTDFIENDICRIMVGCSRCTCPSIHLSFRLRWNSADHGRLPGRGHVQAFTQKLALAL